MKKNILYMAAAAALLFSSCAAELDTDPQGGSLSDEQLEALMKTDPEVVLEPMLSGAIMYLHNGTRIDNTSDTGFMVWNLRMDLQGNDMVLSALTNWFADEYMFENLRQQTAILTADQWYNYYKVVYKANQVLDLIKIVEEPSSAVLTFKAQALTYRALGYYYLMAIYQDDYMHGGKDKAGVPYYDSVGEAKGRTPSTEVYSNIMTDLKDAIGIFKQAGYDAMSSTSDIDQSVANMLLARVALTTGDYTTAANAAAAVIAEPYTLMNEEQYTTSGFLKATLPETIWAYTWTSASSNENKSFASWISVYCNAAGLSNNKNIFLCIDERLYNQIPDTDYRKNNFLAAAEGAYPAYANKKFYNETYRTDEIFMRLSEAYLLKAEAEARDGNDAAAQQTLYDLVSKRDSGYTKSSKTGDALLEEIYLQSRIELWGEGHEFYTNKRFNKGVDRTSSANHVHKAVKAAGKEFTYQIPLSIELNSNPYINDADQNPL